MYVLAVAGLIALLTWLFSDRIAEQRNPNREVMSTRTSGGAARVVLLRNRAGHYVASGRIDDVAAEFIVDTGATDVAVSADIGILIRGAREALGSVRNAVAGR